MENFQKSKGEGMNERELPPRARRSSIHEFCYSFTEENIFTFFTARPHETHNIRRIMIVTLACCYLLATTYVSFVPSIAILFEMYLNLYF